MPATNGTGCTLRMDRDARVKWDGMHASNGADCTRVHVGTDAGLERGGVRRGAPFVPFLIRTLAQGSHGEYDREVTALAFTADYD